MKRLKKAIVFAVVTSMVMSSMTVSASTDEDALNPNASVNSNAEVESGDSVNNTLAGNEDNNLENAGDNTEKDTTNADEHGNEKTNDESLLKNAAEGDISQPEEEDRYYKDYNEASNALRSHCGIMDPTHYTPTQGDLIYSFLQEWGPRLYDSKNESEANAILAEAKVAFDALNLDDPGAMEDHEQLMQIREEAANEKAAIMNANISDSRYTKSSRDAYETEARKILTKIANAKSIQEVETEKANFDALASMLEEYSADLLAAKEAAKNEINKFFKEECESVGSVNSYLNKIDEAESIDEINKIVTESKPDMINNVNNNIKSYTKAKRQKVTECLNSYKDRLGDRFVELDEYVTNNIMTLFNAKTKDEADNAYLDLIDGIEAKADEILFEMGQVEITDVVLSETSIELKLDETFRLSAAVYPSNVPGSVISWSSNNEEVATVEDGLVTAKSVGDAVITVTAGKITKQCDVKVVKEADPTVEVKKIVLDKTSLTLNVGDVEKVNATVLPENATDKTVVWVSENPDVATVDGQGNIKAIAEGSTNVFASSGNVFAKCEIVVNKQPTEPEIIPVTSVTLDKASLTMETGKTETLVVTVNPENATNKEAKWETSDSAIVTVNNGTLKAVKAGKASITVTVDGKSATCEVTVKDPVVKPEVVPVEKIILDKTRLTMEVGKTDKIKATVMPENATDKTVVWESSDSTVVSVDENGNVKALKAGKAKITAIAENGNEESIMTRNAKVMATCEIEVKEPTSDDKPDQKPDDKPENKPDTKPETDSKNETSTNDENSLEVVSQQENQPNTAPKTGDTSTIFGYMLILLIAGIGAISFKKRLTK